MVSHARRERGGMGKERHPFYYLDGLVSLLLIDDDKQIRNMLGDLLAPIRIYTIKKASCAAQAEAILASPQRTHLCVMDLGLSDIDKDEFYLLRRFGGRVSFVVLTGSNSPQKGFTAHQLGARTIIEKGGGFDPSTFIRTVNHHALLNVINPRYGMSADTLTASTDVLFRTSPQFVSEWALELGITDRELRNVWTKNLGANTKIILAIHQMFSAALNYYEWVTSPVETYRNTAVEELSGYRRLEEYFHCHRSVITDFIEYGNVVNFL
ncbi:MAG: response regulator [Chitinivibrionales bacterium]|nr:response regulator [Chitinivibrionales bacterium]MBD3356443.1 response regulator [Chitinivibrionales bacterium]